MLIYSLLPPSIKECFKIWRFALHLLFVCLTDLSCSDALLSQQVTVISVCL